MYKPEIVCQFFCCCILHNYALLHKGHIGVANDLTSQIDTFDQNRELNQEGVLIAGNSFQIFPLVRKLTNLLRFS
ncbi:hypothetical protein XELAEV_18021453mg [Xenopus laevis]|uniref:Uncharacterized protein n=1 Tax=Xenopus laevis TaxID=8355 RepID=A0A974HRK8_XENLA|nr:hypothetical protein XELAEV_18021453mg [Xenopus laevis]